MKNPCFVAAVCILLNLVYAGKTCAQDETTPTWACAKQPFDAKTIGRADERWLGRWLDQNA